MGLSVGWFRLWAVAGVMILAGATFIAFDQPDALVGFDARPCIAGSEETVTNYDLIHDPTPNEVAQELKTLRGNAELGVQSPEVLLNLANDVARQKIFADAEYTHCVSVARLLEHIFMALVTIAAMIAVTLVGRWVFNGFKRQNSNAQTH